MVNPEELRFICTRCGNCCTDRDTIVNITYLDILRLKTSLKLDLKETIEVIGFYVFHKKLTERNLKKMVVSPIETERGLAFTGLLKNSLGECYFFDNKKLECLIYDVRPMLCRTFPFSFYTTTNIENQAKGKVEICYTEKAKEYCPGIGLDSEIIEHDHWLKIGKETLKQLKKNHLFNEKWNINVKNGSILPKVKNYLRTIFKINET